MQINSDDLKFNYGCASCGYKEVSEHIDTDRVLKKLDSIFDKNDLAEAERLLLYWQNEAKEIGDMQGMLTILNELIGIYRRTNNYEKSKNVINMSLEIIDKLEMNHNISIATILLNIATNLNSFGDSKESLQYYEKTLAIYSKNINQNDELFGSFYNNYASALFNTGNTQDAVDAYKSAIKIMSNIKNSKIKVAISYINLSYIYQYINQNNNAIECINLAYQYIISKDNIKDRNYYFELSKCVEPFKEFGFIKIANDFEKQINNFYNSNKLV